MPILGKEGQSLKTRLFGRPGLQNTGQVAKQLATGHASALGAIAKRAAQGAMTGGGIIPKVYASGSSNDNQNTPAPTQGITNYGAVGPAAPARLGQGSGDAGRAASAGSAAAAKIIGAGWDDANDVLSDTKQTLKSTGNVISGLGKVRDQYLKANDEHKSKTDLAIAGNKTLIEKNQNKELDTLGEGVRESAKDASLILGVKNATGGSATRSASRAIAKKAGKERAGILKTRGDEFSAQKQAEQNALEEYNLRREQAYDWEKQAKEQAFVELKAGLAAAKKMESKIGTYKAKDIEAESDKYLQRFLGTLAQIAANGKAIRENAFARMQEFGGSVDELQNLSISTDAPSELDTPDFSEDINLEDPNNAEDFFDPLNKNKQRVVVGVDALGNPIYEDELAASEIEI
jgi:hypothetical protein